jgi:hypothetical protein
MNQEEEKGTSVYKQFKQLIKDPDEAPFKSGVQAIQLSGVEKELAEASRQHKTLQKLFDNHKENQDSSAEDEDSTR